MSSTGFLASLNLGTLIIVLLIVAGALFFFLKRRSNRNTMDGRQDRNVAQDLDAGREAKDHSPRE